MKLSKNFDLEEFIYSETADRMGIDNTPDGEVINNIQRLVTDLLQPLRSLYGKPIHINSGYRCMELNEAVGGVETSYHRRGLAADCRVDNPKELLTMLKASGLKFDQAILYPTFLHIGYNPARTGNRMQVRKKEYH